VINHLTVVLFRWHSVWRQIHMICFQWWFIVRPMMSLINV